jgi:hypothetical protein
LQFAIMKHLAELATDHLVVQEKLVPAINMNTVTMISTDVLPYPRCWRSSR